ncbi:HAMP domain-containing sensor histidine kinase (plasmid) [Methylocapsa polymorpha]|uniref:histidine kinase n=1 Tax=Methylocapsa polymorpha TaxID=3080828 RepID=A0ABZ0HX67_9HYPH|nr:HAMP domain-containing sensor histidine kinase [Methylocapsa sp. RX1]WOJ91828.1 HAMP domain-containing sensor histidine kinase [Methylocapsa sp. RX1]
MRYLTNSPASLKARLLVAQCVVFVAALLAFIGTYLAFEKGDMRYHVIDATYDLTHQLARAIVKSPDGIPQFAIPISLAHEIERYPHAQYGAIDEATGGAVVCPGQAMPPAELPKEPNVSEGWFRYVGSDNVPRNGAFKRVITPYGSYRVYFVQVESVFGLTLAGLEDELHDEIFPVFLPMMIVGLLVTWNTVRRALRPLQRASDEAATISMDRPNSRVSTDRLPAEILPLVTAINKAIGRLQAALAQQRRFSANAAHQLRTPLAILRTRIDGLPPTTVRTELLRDVDRMTRLVSQLLTAARLEAGQMANFEEVDLTEFVRRILAEIAPLAHAADRDLELDSPGKVTAIVSASALEEAVRNLVDNALRHTPPGSTVCVSVQPGATIEVSDSGPGVPLELRGQVFEPFWSAARKSEGGSGLGLAIVHEAMQAQGGSVEIADAKGGGAIFRLALPQDSMLLRERGLASVDASHAAGTTMDPGFSATKA